MKIEIEIPMYDIQCLLCNALEGGSNYWYRIVEFIKPEQITNRIDNETVFRHIDYPTNPGGGLLIEDIEGDDNKSYLLNLESINNGLKVMRDKYTSHFSDFLSERGDATTGDVFLQCCLFGEVIFG